MRVVFAIGSMGGGGAERQVIHYLRHLDRRQVEPILYLTNREGELLTEVPHDVPVTSFWERHPRVRFNFPGRIHSLQVADLANVLDEWNADALCAITFHLAMVAVDSVRRRRTPWLAVEMADPREAFDVQTSRFRWMKRRLVSRAYRQATKCIAVSDGVRDGMSERFGTPRDHIVTIPNCVDMDEVDRLAALPTSPLAPDRFHIAMMGRLHMQKGHRYFLEALNELVRADGRKKLQAHFLGQGPLEGELREYVQSHQLEQHVIFAGFQSNPFAYLKQCQLFCLPSLFEGLPLALLEAIVCGLPVIAADCPSGPREILDGGRLGKLVEPRDSRSLAQAMREMIDHTEQSTATAAQARIHVEQQYSAKVCIPQLERELLRTQHPSAAGR